MPVCCECEVTDFGDCREVFGLGWEDLDIGLRCLRGHHIGMLYLDVSGRVILSVTDMEAILCGEMIRHMHFESYLSRDPNIVCP